VKLKIQLWLKARNGWRNGSQLARRSSAANVVAACGNTASASSRLALQPVSGQTLTISWRNSGGVAAA